MKKVLLTRGRIDWLSSRRVFFGPQGNGNLREGRELLFDDDLHVEPYVCFTGTLDLMAMGSFSYINSNPGFRGIAQIGRYCSIASGVVVPRPRHPMEWLSTSTFTHQINREPVASYLTDLAAQWAPRPASQRPGVQIGNDVWIGLNAMLMPGVRVGDGAVIAAGSVVTKDVGAYEIVGGNPARVIRLRFGAELVQRLLGSRWWEFDFRQFGDLDIQDPARFIDSFERRRADLTPFAPEKVRMAEIEAIA